MKTAKLIIDGKEIEVQISDKQVEELTAPKKVTGFERADSYLYIDSEGDIGLGYDEDDVNSDCHYAVANYYTNRRLAEWCKRSDTLTRQMRRWAAGHNTKPADWDCHTPKWSPVWNNVTQKVEAYGYITGIDCGQVYFVTKELAEAAIEEFGDEIKWLTENRPKWF
jgi:hypothetical protein|nr:MAG TPA: hypothetical protein [Caudoviricetes sp.]